MVTKDPEIPVASRNKSLFVAHIKCAAGAGDIGQLSSRQWLSNLSRFDLVALPAQEDPTTLTQEEENSGGSYPGNAMPWLKNDATNWAF